MQLAKTIYHRAMTIMKNTLDLEEMAFRESGRNDPKFRTFKKHLMQFTYDELRHLFDELVELKIIEKTDYPEDLKQGYADTESGGSGYLNAKDFDKWLTKGNKK